MWASSRGRQRFPLTRIPLRDCLMDSQESCLLLDVDLPWPMPLDFCLSTEAPHSLKQLDKLASY